MFASFGMSFIEKTRGQLSERLQFLVDAERAVKRNSVGAGDVCGLDAAVGVDDVELNFFAFLQEAETVRLDLRLVHEHFLALALVVAHDETVTLGDVEPFHGTGGHGAAENALSDVGGGDAGETEERHSDCGRKKSCEKSKTIKKNDGFRSIAIATRVFRGACPVVACRRPTTLVMTKSLLSTGLYISPPNDEGDSSARVLHQACHRRSPAVHSIVHAACCSTVRTQTAAESRSQFCEG